MSIESAKAFLERVQNDEDFRKELEDLTSAEERMKFAEAQGFGFTKAEIDSLKDELSEGQLAELAGGAASCMPSPSKDSEDISLGDLRRVIIGDRRAL